MTKYWPKPGYLSFLWSCEFGLLITAFLSWVLFTMMKWYYFLSHRMLNEQDSCTMSTPLHVAIANKNKAFAQAVMMLPDVRYDLADATGNTVLHLATINDDVDLLKVRFSYLHCIFWSQHVSQNTLIKLKDLMRVFSIHWVLMDCSTLTFLIINNVKPIWCV